MVLTGLLERLGPGRPGDAPCCGRWTSSAKIGPRSRGRGDGRRRPAATRRSRPAKSCDWPTSRGGNDEVLAPARAAGGRQRDRARPAWPGSREMLAGVAGGRRARRTRLQLDVSIARGLDYYTGTVFETFLDDLPGIGSVCSGGRYDNLAELYTKQELPGIGASLGLDRLLAAMEELGMIDKVAHAGPGVHPLLRRGPAARLPAPGRADCAPRASAWKSIPSRRSSASN